MTHDELLEMVKFRLECAELKYLQEEAPAVKALLSVVELHKPELHQNDNVEGCVQCSSFSYRYVPYPCPTIRVIAKELS